MVDAEDAKKVVFLRGARVTLRPFDVSDLPTLLAWVNEPEIRRFITRPLPINEAQEREFIEKTSAGPDSLGFAICDRSSQEMIGCCGLHGVSWTSRHAEMGVFLADPARRGGGLGSEAFSVLLDYAFDSLGLHRCWLRVYADNAHAIRCYERLGFVREGVDREAHFGGGRFVDVVRYSILDREWRSRRPE